VSPEPGMFRFVEEPQAFNKLTSEQNFFLPLYILVILLEYVCSTIRHPVEHMESAFKDIVFIFNPLPTLVIS
jgi:hypothetical protein